MIISFLYQANLKTETCWWVRNVETEERLDLMMKRPWIAHSPVWNRKRRNSRIRWMRSTKRLSRRPRQCRIWKRRPRISSLVLTLFFVCSFSCVLSFGSGFFCGLFLNNFFFWPFYWPLFLAGPRAYFQL